MNDETNPRLAVPMRAIISAVCEIHGRHPSEISGRRRCQSIVIPRHEFFWLAHRRAKFTLSEIGMRAGNRDHTTVLHGIRATDNRMLCVEGYAAEVDAVWTRAREIARNPRSAKIVRLAATPPKPTGKATEQAAGGQTQAGSTKAAPTPKRPPEAPLGPSVRHWSKCVQFTPEWFRANDAAFRRGLARAYGLEAAE